MNELAWYDSSLATNGTGKTSNVFGYLWNNNLLHKMLISNVKKTNLNFIKTVIF